MLTGPQLSLCWLSSDVQDGHLHIYITRNTRGSKPVFGINQTASQEIHTAC